MLHESIPGNKTGNTACHSLTEQSPENMSDFNRYKIMHVSSVVSYLLFNTKFHWLYSVVLSIVFYANPLLSFFVLLFFCPIMNPVQRGTTRPRVIPFSGNKEVLILFLEYF